MSNNWTQASFLPAEEGPLACTGGVTWSLDDPACPARLPDKRREPKRATLALRAYLQLGPNRSLAALLAECAAQGLPNPPSLRQIKKWGGRFAWPERARRADELALRSRQQELAERQRRVLLEGVATTLERVEELKQRYAELKKDLQREERVWLTDVKYQRVEDGRYERVETLRFNAALISQARGLLADLARETGGRVLRTEISAIPNQQPARPRLDFSGLSKEELDVLEKALHAMGVDDELFPE